MAAPQISEPTPSPYRILTLDGGGAKGFYTLGILREIEGMVGGRPLCEIFDLIFGTSTGAIIAAMLATGRKVDDIYQQYHDHVPTIMKERNPAGKSEQLERLAHDIFGDATFNDVKTGVGIVTVRRQMIWLRLALGSAECR
ncbi:patatin-like phospholipase family protein, partial [Devosia alba]|uniref:patatin-like phospholipase family protein n=1 Tax=Devosia alba TaxID=3152360 RepID=UPI00326519C4